jgi:predicted acylesterase/phospholipase RssA
VSGLPVFLLSRPSRPVASFAGISIGSINVAIIAGHPPETRVDMLRTFWQTITGYLFGLSGDAGAWFARGDAARGFFNQMSAGLALASGAPGTIEATSYYDIRPLKSTLEHLIDFERIDGEGTRLSLGAVNVRTGNLVYFDTTTHVIRPEHEDRWRAGYDDTVHTLRHPEIFERPAGVRGGVYTFDLARDV